MKTTTLTRPIVSWLTRSRSAHGFPLCDFERIRYELKSCDVLLVEGRSHVSEVIKLTTQSPWSHAALYIGRLHDIEDPALRATVAEQFGNCPEKQLIIESELGLGTIVRELSSYRDFHVRICRPRGLSYPDSQKVIHYAINKLGTDYDVRQVFDLARFLFPWSILPRRWRSSLFAHNAGNPTRTVCSTMIAEAFGFIQFPILPLVKKDGKNGVQMFRRNPKLCTPRDFDYSPYFEIIKYPFMDFADHSSYRLLPWHGKGILSDEEASLYIYPSTEKPTEAIPADTGTMDAEFAPEPEQPSEADATPQLEEAEAQAQKVENIPNETGGPSQAEAEAPTDKEAEPEGIAARFKRKKASSTKQENP